MVEKKTSESLAIRIIIDRLPCLYGWSRFGKEGVMSLLYDLYVDLKKNIVENVVWD